MKKILNLKYLLYVPLPVACVVFGALLFLERSAVNYAIGAAMIAAGAGVLACLFLFVPHSYAIDDKGIKTYYKINTCNFIPWGEIEEITTRFDMSYDVLFFWRDYVVSHKNSKRHGRSIDTVTKTKRTAALIEKYWYKSLN